MSASSESSWKPSSVVSYLQTSMYQELNDLSKGFPKTKDEEDGTIQANNPHWGYLLTGRVLAIPVTAIDSGLQVIQLGLARLEKSCKLLAYLVHFAGISILNVPSFFLEGSTKVLMYSLSSSKLEGKNRSDAIFLRTLALGCAFTYSSKIHIDHFSETGFINRGLNADVKEIRNATRDVLGDVAKLPVAIFMMAFKVPYQLIGALCDPAKAVSLNQWEPRTSQSEYGTVFESYQSLAYRGVEWVSTGCNEMPFTEKMNPDTQRFAYRLAGRIVLIGAVIADILAESLRYPIIALEFTAKTIHNFIFCFIQPISDMMDKKKGIPPGKNPYTMKLVLDSAEKVLTAAASAPVHIFMKALNLPYELTSAFWEPRTALSSIIPIGPISKQYGN